MVDREDDGTLKAPGGGSPEGGHGLEREPRPRQYEGAPPTQIIRGGQGIVPAEENVCLRCGYRFDEGTVFCPNCGATLKSTELRDMRPALEAESDAMRGHGSRNKPEVQRMTTSYGSGVLSAKSEQERISPVPSPQISPVQQAGKKVDESRSGFNLALAVTVIAFLTIIVIILILLITRFL